MTAHRRSKVVVPSLASSPGFFLFVFTTLVFLIAGTLRSPAADIPPQTGASSITAIRLLPEQETWLRQHPQIRVGMDPAWPPYSYYSREGELVGIDPDMLHLLGQRLGITFTPVSGKNWTEVYALAQSGQVDMFSGIAESPERLKVLNFTESYVEFPVGLITRVDAPFMIGLPDLEGRVVATPRDYAITFYLKQNYPRQRLMLTENIPDALRLVSRGDAYATLSNLASANYIIKDRGFSNLKVAGFTDYKFAPCYGVRKDWPELIPILQQALASISDRERESIKNKWINLDFDELIATQEHGHVLLLCLGLASVAILLVLIWNWTLDREVRLRKRVEVELREARDRADEANRMKSVFLANLSHEIRNPLHAMLGFSGLLKQGLSDPRLQKHVDALDAGGRALLGIINDVLDLSKVEAGHLDIHLAPIDFRLAFGETVDLFSQRAAQKGLRLTCEIDPALPPRLMFDELRLRQILYNCLSNAIKFTAHGSVCLRASFVPDSETSREGTLIFEISDTGAGIPAGEHARIFEPFAQREGQSSHLGGTGLGLSIARRLTELMAGRIELESEPGQGTTFRFIFPQVQAASPDPSAVAVKTDDLASLKPLKVLIVDDMESNRELLREYFERASHTVWEAGDAEQGIVSAQTYHPDVAIIDYHLPDLDGGKAAARLKSDPRTRTIPVIFITGSLQTDLHDAGLGDAIILAKPLAQSDLVKALRRLLPQA